MNAQSFPLSTPRPSSGLKRFALTALAACLLSPLAYAGGATVAPLFSAIAPVAGSNHYLAQVQTDLYALSQAAKGQVFRLALPGVGDYEVVFDSSIDRGTGSQWMGHLKQGIEFSVVLQSQSGAVTGEIHTPKGNFRLGQANGGLWLAQEGVAGADLAALPQIMKPVTASAAALARKPAKAAYPVQFDLVAMSNLEAGAEVALTIPGLGSHRVIYEESRNTDSGAVSWIGYLKDYGNDFRVLITSSPEGSVGNILTPSGDLQLTQDGNQQWLIDRAGSGLTMLKVEHDDGVVPGVSGSSSATGSNSRTTSVVTNGMTAGGVMVGAGSSTTVVSLAKPTAAAATPSAAATTSPTTQIDVLILYTPGFVSRSTSWRLRLDQLVALANQAYVDSGVSTKLRLVGVEQISYADTTTNSAALSLLQTSSGAFSTVAALRKKYGADLVTLVRPFYMSAQGQNCGVGYIGGYGGSNISGYSAYGVAVVSDGTDVMKTGYYCTDYTYAHELGHNMGSMHDRATVTSQGGGTGAYPYSFGYGKSGSFGTVMSYISPVVGKFSNPAITCAGTTPCGIAETSTTTSANNAKSLNNTRAAVAAYVAQVMPDTVAISGTVATSAKVAVAGVTFTLTASGNISGGSCTTSGSNGLYTCTVPYGWSGKVTPVLTGKTFAPASLSYSYVQAGLTNQNYVRN